MNYAIFLDESGNTGNPRLKNNKWNWGSQPYFALGSLCIKEEERVEIGNAILTITNSYYNGLGSEIELKSTSKYRFKNEMLVKIVDLLSKKDTKFYIDITNKRFQIIKYIVEYCIFPYYMLDKVSSVRDKKVNAATYLYNNLTDEMINKFITLATTDLDDDHIISMILKYLDELKSNLKDKEINSQINNVEVIIANFKLYGLSVSNLLPLRDMTNKGSEMCFLPNLDAFLNIIASTATLRISKNDKLSIYHDKQKQFDQSIIKWTEKMRNMFNIKNLNKIEFVESKGDILVQTIDFITGQILKKFTISMNTSYQSKKEKELVKVFKSIAENCNIVSTKYEQDKFFGDYNIRYGKTVMPKHQDKK